MKILEINNTDIPGKRFNGYDLIEMINSKTNHTAKQMVLYKMSSNDNVIDLIPNEATKKVMNIINDHKQKDSLQMFYVPFAYKIMDHPDFKDADLVHYHLIHNNIVSLTSLPKLFSAKKSIWTIHDPWAITGHCIYPRDCKKYQEGCKGCEHLDYVFPLENDNSNFLWETKKIIYEKIKDVDIVVASRYMEKLIKGSKLMSCFKNIHYIPFGIDLNKFVEFDSIKRKEVRQKYGFEDDEIVLFFRAQDTGVKGIEYIREALSKLKTKKKVSILTCNDVGLLEKLKNKYKINEIGWVSGDDQMIELYNACDIFLMPSTAEAFGLMAIEAMACGKPVVVFENTSLSEVAFVPKCGLAAKWCDADSLKDKILYLIDNEKERIERGKLSRELAEKNYDIEDYHKNILKLYEEVANRK